MEKDYKKLIELAEKNQLIKLTDEEVLSAINDFETYFKQFEIFDNIPNLDQTSNSIFPYELFGEAREDVVNNINSKDDVLANSPKHNSDFVIAKKESK